MKRILVLMLLLLPALSIGTQFLVRNEETAPRADVYFLYSPTEFKTSTIMVKSSVGTEAKQQESLFSISTGDPVVVDNGVFKLLVWKSGTVAIRAGYDIVSFYPSILDQFDSQNYYPGQSDVQVFQGNRMTSILWTPLNQTYNIYRIARVWYGEPWVRIDTFISSDRNRTITLSEHLDNINVGAASADTVYTLLKDGYYDGVPYDHTFIPTEGWLVSHDGADGLGVGIPADEWMMDYDEAVGNINITTRNTFTMSGTQKEFTSYFWVLGGSGEVRPQHLQFNGGWNYRFDMTGEWKGGDVGVIEDQRRDESATFYLPQLPINATLSSLSIKVSSIVGTNPSLQCLLNGYHVFERDVPETGTYSVEFPAYWLEWDNNTIQCYAKGGDVVVPDVWLGLASVDGAHHVWGGSRWQFTSLNILSNSTANARIDIDSRDLDITRNSPSVVVLDSNLRRIHSSYTYPVISFNASVRGNVTNTYFICYGDGEPLELSAPQVNGQLVQYTTDYVSYGAFGAAQLERAVHLERAAGKRTVPAGVQTGGARAMFYQLGEGIIARLVLWR